MNAYDLTSLEVDFQGTTYETTQSGKYARLNYIVTLCYNDDSADFPFHTGEKAKEPVLQNVLYCLCADAELAQESFEDFADNCGYDKDSRKAYKIYKQCKDNAKVLRELYGKRTFERLCEFVRSVDDLGYKEAVKARADLKKHNAQMLAFALKDTSP